MANGRLGLARCPIYYLNFFGANGSQHHQNPVCTDCDMSTGDVFHSESDSTRPKPDTSKQLPPN